jgi:hypothetical protein
MISTLVDRLSQGQIYRGGWGAPAPLPSSSPWKPSLAPQEFLPWEHCLGGAGAEPEVEGNLYAIWASTMTRMSNNLSPLYHLVLDPPLASALRGPLP